MSAQQPPKDYQHTDVMDQTIINGYSPAGKGLDDEQDRLIAKTSSQEEPSNNPYHKVEDDAIDPLHQLVKNNDVVPLLAVLDRIDLNTIVEGKPLLSRLCTLHLPLSQLLKGREVVFTADDDKRTALHEAIAADDVNSAFWCLQRKIGNSRDNFGNTPILQAIKLGRRSCFLLCLHYDYLDSEATHACAIYNRAWELKILHRLGIDIFWQRDSQHFTPLERAVQNYSYDVAEFITSVNPKIPTNDLSSKTDSKGIINLVNRIKSEYSYFNYAILPLILLACHIFIVYQVSLTEYFILYQQPIGYALILILVLKACLSLFSCSSNNSTHRPPDFLGLLKAPQFPPMMEICPHCLSHPQKNHEHCLKCNACVPKFHYHGFVCVNQSNEIFWFLSEVCWFWLVYYMHEILYNSFQRHSLKIINFSSNLFFGNAAIIDHLWQKQNYAIIAIFIYLKVFMIYQFMCVFQWLYMLVLNRTYQQANHSERYTKLYRIGKTMDGSYKSQEIRLMENGFLPGVLGGLANLLLYFFR